MSTELTHSFLGALRPLTRRLSAERTISAGKLGALGYLAEHGRATSSELAVVQRVTPQAMSLAMQELEQLGLVERVRDSADRRRVWNELTDAGRQKLAEERLAGQAWLDRMITERLTPAERATLEAVIPTLQKLGAEASVA